MVQQERLIYLLKELIQEKRKYFYKRIPKEEQKQKDMLRSLLNVRKPAAISDEFIKMQNEYMQEELNRKGIIDTSSLQLIRKGIYLWKGDISTLRCDAIVNAADRGMTGCYIPLHPCVDNCIHSAAGIELRLACDKLIQEQGHKEKIGGAKITPSFNLPCKYVLHTVGPVVHGWLTKRNKEQLASCYRSCLKLAEASDIKSLAFCCISTGRFHFPNDKAAEIAVRTVTEYQKQSDMKVIFAVFKDIDYEIYKKLLKK